jgi:hypothetical protein
MLRLCFRFSVDSFTLSDRFMLLLAFFLFADGKLATLLVVDVSFSCLFWPWSPLAPPSAFFTISSRTMSGRLSEPLLDTGWLGLVSPEIQKKKKCLLQLKMFSTTYFKRCNHHRSKIIFFFVIINDIPKRSLSKPINVKYLNLNRSSAGI